MNIEVKKIGKGKTLGVIGTDKFKFNYLALNFLLPKTEENIASAVILARVLARGSEMYPDIKSINKKLGMLYGANVSFTAGDFGDKFSLKICAGFLDGHFLPKGEKMDILGEMTEVLYQLLSRPIVENGGLVLLISLALGAFIGEILKIDDHLNGLGAWVEKRVKSDGFSKGFVSAFIIFCVGSMSIIGAVNDGLSGDSSVLFVKSTLDFITAMVLASAMGIGVVFACVPLFAYQGIISLFASYIKPVIEEFPDMMTQFSMVGYAIIMCIGINFIAGQKIKTANLLPAMLIPVMYNLLNMVENLW